MPRLLLDYVTRWMFSGRRKQCRCQCVTLITPSFKSMSYGDEVNLILGVEALSCPIMRRVQRKKKNRRMSLFHSQLGYLQITSSDMSVRCGICREGWMPCTPTSTPTLRISLRHCPKLLVSWECKSNSQFMDPPASTLH